MKKYIKNIGIGLGVSILLLMILFVSLFWGEIRTLTSLKQIDQHPFYQMNYYGDYGLNEFLEEGAATDEALVAFVVGRILKGIPLEINPDGACSTFIATSPEGDALFGRNFDYVDSVGLVLHTKPKNAYESISVVNLNHLGLDVDKLPTDSLMNRMITLAAPYAPLEGINEKGLAIGVLIVKKGIVNQDTGKIPITTTTAIRMILDQAATVEEAIALLNKYDMHSSGDTGYHFQIADATGNTVIVEYIGNKMHVLTKEEGHTAATNFILYNNMNIGVGQDRYKVIKEKQAETQGIMTQEEVLEVLLSIPARDTRVIKETQQVIQSDTEWSAVYNLDNLSMALCTGRNRERTHNFYIK